MRSPLRSPAQVEGTQRFLPQPGKDLERPSSTRLEARVPSHGSGAMTRSPSPLAWRFYYFAGFNGYMLLGHYIQQYVNWSWKKTLSVSLPLVVVGFLITYSGYTYIMELPDKTPEQVELFWTYNTPNVAMMTFASFLLVYRIRITADSRLAKWLAHLTTCGFGVYMIHYYFVCVGYDLGAWLHIPDPLRIPFSAIVILACSWTIVSLAKKGLGKYSKYLLG